MRIRIQNYHFHILYCKNFIMSARLIRLVYLRLASALQLCPKWTCNNVQKYFAILSKKGLQKTYIGLIERGERSVTLEKLILLAECFHVTIDYLLQDNLPVSSMQQNEQLNTLWSAASEQEKNMILSIIKSVLCQNNKK